MTKSSNKKNEKAPFEVCIVRYTCPTCYRRWHSANGNLEDYQICKNCYERCYPGSYKYQAPNKRGNQNPETYVPHNTELCGKCIRLGHSCMEELGLERPNRVVSNFEGESVTLDDSQDFSSYFKFATATKKKPEKKPISKKMERLLDKQAWSQLMDAGKKKPEGKEGAALVSNVIDKEGTPANNKENVVLKVVGKDETVSDIGNDDSKEASTQDLGTDNIDGDNTCTDDNITDNESFRDATPEHSTPDMEGTTTPVTAEEDSKCISSNETTEDFTMENLSIGDNNSNDKPKEEYDDKHQ